MKPRSSTPKTDTWNLDPLYSSLKSWEEAFNAIKHGSTLSTIASFKGTLSKGPDNVLQALVTIFEFDRNLSKLYTWAHLRHDEDVTNDDHKIAFKKIFSYLHEFQTTVSWLEPELVALPQNTINSLLNDKKLEKYRFHLEKIFRQKLHTLSSEEERLCALASKGLSSTHKAFSALNDADFSFGEVADSQGVLHPLSHASWRTIQQSHDRPFRHQAFNRYFKLFSDHQNTMAELLSGTVEAHIFQAKAHNYKSSLEAALFPKNIDTTVYHSLIEATEENLSALHRYIELRKKILNVDQLQLWDMYVPLTQDVDIKMSYKEAEEAVIASVAPLGSAYQNLLKKGLQEERWVDRYENKGKRSGAYSSGCYDSSPFILMNYNGTLRDVFTLAHEAGHSMHSILSHQNQPYHMADYPIFLAEVASTFNEELLMNYLLEKLPSTREKIYLINQKIEDIRATLFRQVMFAEFELLIHKLAEENSPLTPALLNSEYRKLNQKYFGPAATIDPQGDIEWARIPHFYYNFYVYQYATGISASLALTDRVLKGSAKERNDYLNFLKGGSSRYPLDLLKMAGVDMTTKKPVTAAMQTFKNLVSTLDEMLVAS